MDSVLPKGGARVRPRATEGPPRVRSCARQAQSLHSKIGAWKPTDAFRKQFDNL